MIIGIKLCLRDIFATSFVFGCVACMKEVFLAKLRFYEQLSSTL